MKRYLLLDAEFLYHRNVHSGSKFVSPHEHQIFGFTGMLRFQFSYLYEFIHSINRHLSVGCPLALNVKKERIAVLAENLSAFKKK